MRDAVAARSASWSSSPDPAITGTPDCRINRRAAMVKLATAGLFVLLAGWLVVALV